MEIIDRSTHRRLSRTRQHRRIVERNQAAWVEPAERHIERWIAANPRTHAPLRRLCSRAQAWAKGPGTTMWAVFMIVSVLIMGAGYLWNAWLYDLGEALLLGGGILFAKALIALETGGIPI